MSIARQFRICYLANAASVHTLRWANYIAEHGWRVDLITWHPPRKDVNIHPGIAIHRIFFPPHSLARYGALLEITQLMRKIHPDIIHAHYLGHFGILAGLYARLCSFSPIVLTAWGSDVLTDANGWKKWLIKYAIGKAGLITCDAEHIREALVGLGASPENIELVYFGTDTVKFSPELKNQKLIEELGIADSPVVISLRNLNPVYDVESLVRATPLVLKEAPETKFIIAGDGKQRGYLENLVGALGVSSSVRFVGFIPNDELPHYLNLADICVSTSLSDAGLAASTAEAMACGLPVVITDFGDNRSWVEDGVNGFIVPLRNPQVLASSIVYLLQNEDKRQEFGKANRLVIEERNNWEKEMGKMERLYNELIEKYGK